MFAKKHTIGGIKMKNNLPVHVLGSMQSILDEIEENGILNRWKGFDNMSSKNLLTKIETPKSRGFDFISTLESLNIFLGGNFIEGILYEQEL